MVFKLKELPYSYNHLEPHISKETLEFHHDKHHKAYIDFVNNFIEKNPEYNNKPIEELIKVSYKDPSLKGLFNNASQIFNHDEFWQMLTKSDGKIPEKLEKQMIKDFSSVEEFKTHFIAKGTTLFGSGWVWLTFINGKLEITQGYNAENPVANNNPVLLGCDVWEHSYYIDYRNKRADYLKAFLDNLVNWQYVLSKFEEVSK